MSAKLQKNNLSRYLLYSIFYILVAAAVATPFLVLAAQQLLPPCATGAGRCHLNDIVQTFVNFMRLLLGFVGSAVLVFFVYGGFVWLTSGGSSEKIKKGKDVVINSIIGLIIVFGAFTIVQLISDSLGAEDFTKVGQSCTKDDHAGVYAIVDSTNPKAVPECITDCSGAPLPDAGYSCRDEVSGKNCIPGLCQGGTNIQCCQPL